MEIRGHLQLKILIISQLMQKEQVVSMPMHLQKQLMAVMEIMVII
jgi:hypothetical protein